MDKISLRVYNQEIEGMISGGQLEEAIAHCHHILDSYSMHIETYRLLGKAFLESRRYGDATDIFQRVLNAVPDDFVSHVGMSIIRDDENKRDEAIWHMERAFEVQPSNPAIQNELRRLYGRRDGMEPVKIRLSRDALANMYAQGDLFVQAIAELRTILADDPNRPDLQVMLARAYMRSGQKVESAEVAAQLLRKYPYCMDALRVLVEVLPGTSRAENTQIYRQRLKMMDPYISFVTGSVFDADQVADGAVTLERLEYKAGKQTKSEQPAWAASLGVKLEDDKRDEGQIDWLLGKGDQPVQDKKPLTPGSSPNAGGTDNEIPEFLRDAGWTTSASTSGENQPAGEPSAPDDAIAKAEMPDWLKAMAPQEMPPTEEPVQENISEPEEDLPEWLAGLGITSDSEKEADTHSSAPFIKGEEFAAEFPDQGEQGSEDKGAEAPEAEITPAGGEEIPGPTSEEVDLADYGTGGPSIPKLSGENNIPEGGFPTKPEAETEISTDQATSSEPVPEPQTGQESAFPDWLTSPALAPDTGANEAMSTGPAEESGESAEATPPVMRADENPEPPVEVPEKPAQDALTAADSQLPDWLSGMEKTPESKAESPEVSKTTEFPSQDSLPPELQAELEGQPQPVESQTAAPISAAVKHGDFPDWMASLFDTTTPTDEGSAPAVAQETPGVEKLSTEATPVDAVQPIPVHDDVAQENPPTIMAVESKLPESPHISEEKVTGEHVEAKPEKSEQQSVPSPAEQFPEWMAGLGAAAGVIGAVESANEPAEKGISAAEEEPKGAETSLEARDESPAPTSETSAPPESSAARPLNIEDDTMAWLEGLAARQGAKDEELLTKPEDRPEQLPDWLKDFATDQPTQESGTLPEVAPTEQPAGMLPSEVSPHVEATGEEIKVSPPTDQPIRIEPSVDLKQAFEEPTPPEEEETSLNWLEDLEASHGLKPVGQEVPDEKAPDEFTDWLKGLAAESETEETQAGIEQPTPAALDEAIPTAEPSVQVPSGDQQPVDEIQAQPTDIGELPAWLNEEKVEETGHETPPPDIGEVPETTSTAMDLPEWMKDIQPPSSEPVTDNENLPADLPEWLQKPEEPSAEQQIVEQESASWPPGETETPIIKAATTPEEWMPADQVPSSPEEVAAPTSEIPGEAGKEVPVEVPSVEAAPAPTPVLDKDGLLLADARGAMEENESAEAMKAYSLLIRKNRLLEETIQDLRKASDRHPVDSIVWQTLGDAYMRAGRLQEALDAYTKAEELLK